MDRPVDVARLLSGHGLSLRRAHSTLQRIADGHPTPVELWTDDPASLSARLASLGVEVRPLRVPDVSVQRVRGRFGLSQAEFALRFGFELDTIQNWEQGRNIPDPATRLLLAIIERRPDIVESVLASNDMGPSPTSAS